MLFTKVHGPDLGGFWVFLNAVICLWKNITFLPSDKKEGIQCSVRLKKVKHEVTNVFKKMKYFNVSNSNIHVHIMPFQIQEKQVFFFF